MWNLVKEDSNSLYLDDKKVINKFIPYTELLKPTDIDYVIRNKDNYVIKSSSGRNSKDIYIGKRYTQEKWNEKLKIVSRSNKIHIRQNLISIKQEYTYASSAYNINISTLAFGNSGVYMINYKGQGFLVRWSKNFLTNDNFTWVCPLNGEYCLISIKKFYPKI